MRFETLNDWLAWQETLNPRGIELGLDRMQRVLARLDLAVPPYPVLTVGGTNGKGSVVATLEAVLRAGGYRTGAYFSPHLVRYNERVRLAGAEAGDADFCRAFERVDQARGDIPLTYFEFGTLAALELFRAAAVEVAVLEVGLGGRLDAVNAVEPLASAVVSVGVDHRDWLGPDREAIGREKAGIFRAGRPALCGDPEPPASLLDRAAELGADLWRTGRDFRWRVAAGGRWHWQGRAERYTDLPPPALAGGYQYANAALALAMLEAVRERLPVEESAVVRGLPEIQLSGRLQSLAGKPPLLLDVAHNAEAALTLAAHLAEFPVKGVTRAVFGILADKDAEAVLQQLLPHIGVWYAAGLDGARGRSGAALAELLRTARAPRVTAHDDVAAALAAARAEAGPDDRIVVFGSFRTVGDALHASGA